jgi:serine phosphatase RsbU (regulator of sigma subunit)
MILPLRLFIACFILLSSTHQVFSQSAEDHVGIFNQSVKSKDYDNAALHSYEAGKLFSDKKDFESAKKYLRESSSYARKTNSSTQLILSAHLLGNVFYSLKEFSNAADEFENAAEVAQKTGSHSVAIESYILQARSLAQVKKYKRSIDALTNALNISLVHKFTSGQLTCYQLLAEYHGLSGNVKKAEEFRNLYNTLLTLRENERIAAEKVSSLQNAMEQEKLQAARQKEKLQNAEMVLSSKEDSLSSATQSLKMAEESLKEMEELNQKRQLEINLLNREKELSDLRIQEQNSRLENEALLRNFILAVILLGASLIVVIVFNYRKTVHINKKLDQQNKNIKSSINYAKRIQEAMLPKKEVQQSYLRDSFILFKPRDVVSGDFYWFSPIRNGSSDATKQDLAFGAIDCTGHGVPGAFMSMIGINSLNTILSRGISEANHILDSLHGEIRNALQQHVSGNNDGMDAALCIYRPHKKALEFAGAKNPLVYIQNGQLHQIKGDIHPIGGSKSKKELTFRKHEITVDTETMVYLFTDGYRDQFGGGENQKFLSKRFTQLLLDIHQLPLEEQREKLSVVFEDWKGKNEQTDDVLVIGVRLDPRVI